MIGRIGKRGIWRGLALGCLLAAALPLVQPAASEAAGNIWMDENAEVQAKSFKKVVLFPIRYLDAPDGRVDQFQGYNAALAKRIQKRIKRTNFMNFEDPGDTKAADKKREKREILRDNPAYHELLRHFGSEAERAKAVYDTTGAEGYLLPHIRYEQERVDHSPATWTRVKMERYYDIENGPQGDKSKCNYQSWYADHLIPAHDSTLQMLDMDFRLYDAATGKEAMTLIDYYRNYGVDQWHAFDQIAKNFTGDWNRLKKDSDRKVPAGAPTLGFRNLELPWNASQDEFAIKTIYYAYKDEAGDDLRRVKVDYAPNGGRYYVTGAITDYARGETWCPPTPRPSPCATAPRNSSGTTTRARSTRGAASTTRRKCRTRTAITASGTARRQSSRSSIRARAMSYSRAISRQRIPTATPMPCARSSSASTRMSTRPSA